MNEENILLSSEVGTEISTEIVSEVGTESSTELVESGLSTSIDSLVIYVSLIFCILLVWFCSWLLRSWRVYALKGGGK